MKKYSEEELKAAIELEPENADHVFRIGCLMYENKELLNHYSHAVDVIQKAIVLDPMNGKYQFQLAKMHVQNQCWHQVYRHLKICIQLNYKTKDCEQLIEETKIKEKEWKQKTDEDFIKRMESEPDNPHNLAQLGHQYAYKDKAKAYSYYKKALEIDPDEKNANCGIGRLYGKDGDMEKAIYHLKKGFGPNKYNSKDNHYDEVARIYEDRKDWKNALPWRKKAVEADPADVEAIGSLAWLYMKLNMPEESAQLYHKVLKMAPEEQNRGAYMVLSSYYYKKGDTEKSLEYIMLGIKYNPQDYYFRFNLGRYQYYNKQYGEAEKCFLAALSFKPDDEQTLAALGTLYLATDEFFDTEKGKKYFLKVVEVNDDNLAAHQNLGKIFDDAGNLKRAEHHKNREREIKIKELLG